MSNNSFWGCQTVQEFLSNSNWEGLQIQLEDSQDLTAEPKQQSWLSLTVEGFLAYNTWEGNFQDVSVVEQNKPRPLLQAVSVREFFATMPWQGGGVPMAAIPKSQPKKQELNLHKSQELKLNDLSQLF